MPNKGLQNHKKLLFSRLQPKTYCKLIGLSGAAIALPLRATVDQRASVASRRIGLLSQASVQAPGRDDDNYRNYNSLNHLLFYIFDTLGKLGGSEVGRMRVERQPEGAPRGILRAPVS